ncbi:MAG: hypothetical protein M1828_004123 [Chrysothrix sp. TS-e1954]|nr:MAG: hypothetical protein M1828_004123 [Chrysothrix sp. TS-e1954]
MEMIAQTEDLASEVARLKKDVKGLKATVASFQEKTSTLSLQTYEAVFEADVEQEVKLDAVTVIRALVDIDSHSKRDAVFDCEVGSSWDSSQYTFETASAQVKNRQRQYRPMLAAPRELTAIQIKTMSDLMDALMRLASRVETKVSSLEARLKEAEDRSAELLETLKRSQDHALQLQEKLDQSIRKNDQVCRDPGHTSMMSYETKKTFDRTKITNKGDNIAQKGEEAQLRSWCAILSRGCSLENACELETKIKRLAPASDDNEADLVYDGRWHGRNVWVIRFLTTSNGSVQRVIEDLPGVVEVCSGFCELG